MGVFDNLDEFYENLDESALSEDDALRLLGRLCSRPKTKDECIGYARLRDWLSNWLPDILSRSGLGDESLKQAFGNLGYLAASILENARLPMLRQKTVLGIGGAFSAGKSRFLNALTGVECLPENQGPSTAIGTYLVHGQNFSILAHTRSNGLEALSMEELQTISHQFHDKYKIGFADVLHKLIITSPTFLTDIVLLDTPGYTKPSDNNDLEAVDRRIAREHLKNSDYLMWLIDIESGVVTDSDIVFLRELNPKNPCLVIFNKADKKSPEDILNVVHQSEELLRLKGIPCFGVTAYSSADKEEFLEKSLIPEYIGLASKAQPFSARKELDALAQQWLKSFRVQKAEIDADLSTIEDAVTHSTKVLAIQGMLNSYSSLSRDSSKLYYDEINFRKDMDKFFSTIERNF